MKTSPYRKDTGMECGYSIFHCVYIFISYMGVVGLHDQLSSASPIHILKVTERFDFGLPHLNTELISRRVLFQCAGEKTISTLKRAYVLSSEEKLNQKAAFI